MRSCTSAMNSWKCDAALAHDRRLLEEQVHQHGLAAADLAVDVETFRRLNGLGLSQKPAEGARFFRGLAFVPQDQPLVVQRGDQRVHLGDQRGLSWVALDRSRRHEGFIAGPDRPSRGLSVEQRLVHGRGLPARGEKRKRRRPSALGGRGLRVQRAKVSGAPDLAITPSIAPPDARRRAATAPPG